MTDEELIEETEKTSIEVSELGDMIWQLILKYENVLTYWSLSSEIIKMVLIP